MKLLFNIKYWLSRILVYLFVLPKFGYGAEVGVWRAYNARLLYYLAHPKMLWLIDNYKETKYSESEIEEMIIDVKHRISGKRMALVTRSSEEAAKMWPFNIDWIYIDGDHFDLYNDLTRWYNKIDPGGVIMGDDYSDTWWKVKKDLNQFCKERGIKFNRLHCQWWICK